MSDEVDDHGPGDGGMPRWVKVFLIIAAAAVLLFLVLQLVTGGEHGPRRHGATEGPLPAGIYPGA